MKQREHLLPLKSSLAVAPEKNPADLSTALERAQKAAANAVATATAIINSTTLPNPPTRLDIGAAALRGSEKEGFHKGSVFTRVVNLDANPKLLQVNADQARMQQVPQKQ